MSVGTSSHGRSPRGGICMAASDRAVAFLEMARRDLAATQAMADRHVFAVEVFGFHAQQAVEKALKAWI